MEALIHSKLKNDNKNISSDTQYQNIVSSSKIQDIYFSKNKFAKWLSDKIPTMKYIRESKFSLPSTTHKNNQIK